MNWLLGIVGKLFDLVLAPFAGAPAWGMLVVSLLTAVWALLLFKVVTPQARLAATRDRLLGHLFEMGLYQDHLRIVGRIQRDLARANLRYLTLSLPALVALLVPMVLTLGQLDSRFARRPLQPGETTVFAAKLETAAASQLDALQLVVPDGVTVEAGPVRDRVAGAAAWRLRVDRPGEHDLQVMVAGALAARRALKVGDGLPSLAETGGGNWVTTLLHPGAQPPVAGGPVAETTLYWPARTVRYLGLSLHWLLAFMVFSLVGGLAVKDALRVEI